MKLIWPCLFSPRLYKIYKDGSSDSLYQPLDFEKWGDKVITSVKTIFNLGVYTSPFICLYIYNKRSIPFVDGQNFLHVIGGIGSLLVICFLMRSIGRAYNPKYTEFIATLRNPTTDKGVYLTSIRKYDFEFSAWPVSYAVKSKPRSFFSHQHPFSKCANADLPSYQRVPVQILAYIATHVFALRLIYPGSLSIMQILIWPALLQGRTMLVETYDGQRTKLQTADSNLLDTMFVDQRKRTQNGKTLVICCEGNAGFYEIGIMTTPIKAGYSAFGWNHPGFAESTGQPYPDQEQNAIEAVLEYAINELGFKPQDIVLFGWSIGGYTATWAAVNYPEIKALILDATFDDLLPLGENQMPASWSLLVKEVIRSYADLNIAELITGYPGPIKLIRRTEDEIICLRPGQLSSNRGNHLLMKIVEARYPTLSADERKQLLRYVGLTETQRGILERTDLDHSTRRILLLISKYMRDYKSTHCVPLPEDHFDIIMSNITDAKID